MTTRIFAENFRGFREIDISLAESAFLVGDNSSGKTSILHLIDFVTSGDLAETPQMDSEMNVGRYDFFSPFFENDDVTVGFANRGEDGAGDRLSGKIMTLRKRHRRPPDVVSMTYFRGELAITLRAEEEPNEVGVRVTRGQITSESYIRTLHSDPKGNFGIAEARSASRPLNNPIFAVGLYNRAKVDGVGDDELMQCFFVTTHTSPRHIGPLRGLPEAYYRSDRKYLPSGGHFAVMYRDLRGEKADELRGIVDRFGTESGLFDQMEIEPLTRRKQLEDPPLIVSVTRGGRKFLISQVGIGVSQVAPILVEAVFALRFKNPRNVLLIQQPELHLHPRAQAAMGDFVFELNQRGLVTLIETHSDFIIDRYRSAYRKADQHPPVAVLFCSNNEDGNSIQRFTLDDEGALIGDTAEYLDFFVKEFERTLL